MQSWTCKRCGTQVTEQDLTAGQAIKAGPVVLCARCVPAQASAPPGRVTPRAGAPAVQAPRPVILPLPASPSALPPALAASLPPRATPPGTSPVVVPARSGARPAPLLPAPVPFASAAIPLDKAGFLFGPQTDAEQAPPPAAAPPGRPPTSAHPTRPPTAAHPTRPPSGAPPIRHATAVHTARPPASARSPRGQPDARVGTPEHGTRYLRAGETDTGTRLYWIGGACALGVVLLFVLGYLVLGGKKPAEKKPPDKKPPVVAKHETVPPPVEKKTETQAPAPPPKQEKPPETVEKAGPKTAEEAFNSLFNGVPEGDKERRVALLDKFITEWDDPLYRARAKREWEQLTGLARLDPRAKLRPAKRELRNSQPGLKAEYYKDKDLAGEPALRRVDRNVEFSDSPAPEVGRNDFSVRWTGYVRVEKPGQYVFAISVDDGGRLWLNDLRLVDAWFLQAVARYEHTVELEPGFYQIKCEYFQGGGDLVCRLMWAQRNGFAEQVIPPEALFHEEP